MDGITSDLGLLFWLGVLFAILALFIAGIRHNARKTRFCCWMKQIVFCKGAKAPRISREVSQVNEMLTQMEHFNGVFIASTNFMTAIDSAALRRFDLKIRFDYLKPDQAWQLFTDLCARLGMTQDESLRKELGKVACLTPGDFANVERQNRLRRMRSAVDLLERLKAECQANPDQNRKPIGFC